MQRAPELSVRLGRQERHPLGRRDPLVAALPPHHHLPRSLVVLVP